MLGICFAVFIIISWALSFFIKGVSPFNVLLLSMVIYYPQFIFNLNIDLLIKGLIFFTTILYILMGKVRKKIFYFISLMGILIYGISLLNAHFSIDYDFLDSITAFGSFLMGLMIFCINFSAREKQKVLKEIMFLPVISLIIGIPLSLSGMISYLSRDGTAIAGASLETNLSFFGVIGIMAAIILKNKTKYIWYDYFKIINASIVCITMTRGGILASVVLLIPDIFSFLKVSLIKFKYFVLLIYGGILGIVPMVIVFEKINQRTFIDGQINTSGRLEAWNYIISLVKNKWSGNGYGYLKTLDTDPRLVAFTAAHNEFVRSYFETGILGTLLLLIILAGVFKYILMYPSIRVKYVITIIFSFLIYSFTDNCITNFRYWIPFMCICSCLVGLKKIENRGHHVAKKNDNLLL